MLPLCTLGKALTTRKATSKFNVLDKNEILVDTYFHGVQTARGGAVPRERLAWVTAQGPRTAFSSALVTKVFAANFETVNEFFTT